MLFFSTVNVKSFDLDNFVITWAIDLNPVTEDVTKYRFFVQRSNSPEGPFDTLNTSSPLIDTYTFTDTQLDRLSKWRRYFYRIRATDSTDSSVEIFSDVAEFLVPTLTTQTLVQREIIRTEKILLQGIGVSAGTVGVKCLAFVRRTFGQRCPECWDAVKKKVSKSQCETCFGVGFKSGYHNPIVVYVNFSPPSDQAELTPIGELQPDVIKAWMSNYPPLTGGDLIVDSNNVRWRVVNQTRTEALRNIVRQTLSLYHLPPGDIEYEVQFDTDLLS